MTNSLARANIDQEGNRRREENQNSGLKKQAVVEQENMECGGKRNIFISTIARVAARM
jgi:hypothetical protein